MEALLENDTDGVVFTGLDPILGSLGELVGLLTGTPGSDTYVLNGAWFADPITNTQKGVTQNPQQFGSLLGQVLGKVGGNALGIPVKDAALLGTWYPIKNGPDDTGFYMVSYDRTDGAHPETVLGLGVLHTWQVPDASPVLTVNVWGLLPFVRIGNGSFQMTFDTPGYPLNIGVAAEGGVKDQPLVDINGVSFNGVKFSASIDLPAPDPFSVSLEVLALQLPGDSKPVNRSLADLAAITGEQILETATHLFIGALSQLFSGQDKRVRYMAPLFGLSKDVPDLEMVKMPLLEWYNLFQVASDPVAYPGGVKTLFFNWFNTISADATLLQTWLSCLGGFLGNAAVKVSGTGLRTDPYTVPLLSVTGIGQLGFTVATTVTGSGVRYFYPGLSFEGADVSLGTSDVVFLLQADLELAEFALSNGAVSASPDIAFSFRFSLHNKDNTKPLVAQSGYSFGSLSGGLQLGTGGKIVPLFFLNKVATPQSSFDSVNLLSPGELADTGAALLSNALMTLIGVGGDNTFSDHIAALIGLIVPDSAGGHWPSKLPPPFSPAQMASSIMDPISALASYYYNTLTFTEPVDGKAAFTYLVKEFALLLQNAMGSVQITVDGSGTPADPWKAGVSLDQATLPAYITAYRQTDADGNLVLVMGLALEPQITVGDILIVPSLHLDAISLTFPNGGAGIQADWFPQVSALLTLPNGFKTPSLGGAVVSVNKAQLSAGWSRSAAWSWSMFVNHPTLIIDGQNIVLGQDLNFSDQTALRDLVKASAFSPFLVAALGTLLMRSTTRAGLFTTGVLGLLPDISKSPIFPSGLEWKGFTQLSLSSLSDPWPDIRHQLAQDFGTADTSKSLLSLLSWTIDSSLDKAPPVTGGGSFDDPYVTPLPAGFNAPVWYDATDKILGMGAGRMQTWSYNLAGISFQFDLNARLNGLKYDLSSGGLVFDGQVPSFSLVGTLSNPDALLVNLPNTLGTLEKALLGFNLHLQSGSIVFSPVVTLVGVTLPGQEKQNITLDDFTSTGFEAALQSAFLAMLNQAVQTAIAQVSQEDLFKQAYALLSLLGLTLSRTKDGDPYGINTYGFNALLANYNTYIQSQMLTLLTVPDQRKSLFSFLETILGIQIPALPTAALDLLTGLNICGPADQGYPLYPQALLDLAADPYTALYSRFQALYAADNTQALQVLTTELTKNIPLVKYGRITFGSDANGVISFSVLPADALALGSFLQVSGGIHLDLSNRVLTGDLDIYCPKVGLTLQNVIKLSHTNGVFSAGLVSSLVWGDGSKPSAEPLVLWPFNADEFLGQLADLAPAFTLNILLNAVVEDQLLVRFPLVQQIFTGLGLAQKMLPQSTGVSQSTGVWQSADVSQSTGVWQSADVSQSIGVWQSADASQSIGVFEMSSLMGILRDPLGWLLSDSVLGLNGRFNVGALVRLLSNLPAVTSSNGIALKPQEDGVGITGLPYGFGVAITGAAGTASFSFSAKDIKICEEWGTLNQLSLALQLDEHYQPAFFGGVTISSGPKIPVAFFVETGYDKAFLLKISQGTFDKPSGLSIQLMPFLGWGTLAEQAARLAAAELLNTVVPQILFPALTAAGAGDFVNRLTTFGSLVDVQALVNAILNAFDPTKTQTAALDQIETAALAWLRGRFTVATAPATVDGIITLLSVVVPSGLSREGGRLAYTPGKSLPVTIKAGLNADNLLGLWVDLAIPGTELLKVDIAETGVGIASDGTVRFFFGVHLLIPVDGSSGPALALVYDPGKGFTLDFDPLGDETNIGKSSALSRELLPSFFPPGPGDPADLKDRVTAWLLSVIKNVLPRYVSALVLNIGSIKTWLETPIVAQPPTGVPTPAILLEAVSLLVQTGGKYYLNTVDNLAKLTPSGFLGNLLLTLMQNNLTLLTFGTDKKGSISVGPRAGSPGYYGLRVVAPDLKLDAIPNLVLQLGDNAAGADEWIQKTGGPKGDPGVGFYVPISSDKGDVSVDFGLFQLLLYNLGFDIVGTKGQPIVNLARFKINQVSPRTVFELDFQGTSAPDVTFGAAVSLDSVALSLAPDQMVPGGGSNPIASNILGSGTDDSTGNPPSNPTFSVTAAYTENLWVNLQSNTGNGNEVILPVQRSFGPLYVDSIGLGWEDQAKLLDFLFSGSIDLAGLKTTVIGLTVGVPVTDPTNYEAYTVDLQGLDISFKAGGVEISGGFLKTEITDPDNSAITYISYNGQATIKAGAFSLMALGSYAEVPVSADPGASKAPSLFIFAVLNAPLGGVPAFFITGIAAGFSYNRSIEMPSIDEVQDFPLLKGLVDGTFAEGEDPGKALLQLSSVVKPEIGQYWLAAGIKFTSFELLTTSALLFVSFGKEWEVDLLGLTFASLPPGIPRKFALAYFELAIKVSFKPEEGIVSAQAQLTPNSFVLSTDCKVTGGFAFFLWYKDIVTDDYTIPAGDFVISLGGYHPAFQPPVYYPVVPRLGLAWKMDVSVGSVGIAGGAYFALCPTAVMAGGYLHVAFSAGPLKAWLSAYANFLIEWKPFYFQVGIGVTVGASFGTTIAGVSLTIRAELGAELFLEGPPTHGYVHVDWYVISFTIPIGDDENATQDKNLTWDEFAVSFLPAPSGDAAKAPSGNGAKAPLGYGAMATYAADDDVQQVIKWGAETGLLGSGDTGWIIQPYPFAFSVKSTIPASRTTVVDSDFDQDGVSVGVRPMGTVSDLNAPLTIKVINEYGQTVNLKSRNIQLNLYTNGAPSAMWSKFPLDRNQAPDAATMLIPGASFGMEFVGDRYVYVGDILPFPIVNLAYTQGDNKLLPYKNTPRYPAAERYPDTDQMTAYTVIMQSVMTAGTITKRNEVFAALQAGSMAAPPDPDLSVMASSANFIFQALPVIARIGIYQNAGVAISGMAIRPRTRFKAREKEEKPLSEPRLQGILRRYRATTVRGKWTNATGLTRKNTMLKQSRTALRQDSVAKRVYEGTVVLWAIDDRAVSTLSLEGNQPVRIASFDVYGNLLAFDEERGGTSYTLPEKTAQVAVQGYEADTTEVAGWKRDTLLTKVNSVWALSDAGLVRVQNNQRIRVKTDGSQMGSLDAADLLRENQVMARGGVLIDGWIQSVLPKESRFIGVLVDKTDVTASDVAITVEGDKVPLRKGLNNATIIQTGTASALLLVPVPDDARAYWGVLAKSENKDVRITGIMGFSALPAGPGDVSLNRAGLDPLAPAISSTLVHIASTPKH